MNNEKIIKLPKQVEAITEQLENIVTDTANKFSGVETKKADKVALEVERQRINSFTSLSQGSTTGDAELIDGRIGAYGNNFKNIGTAIRSQIKSINENKLDIGDDIIVNEDLYTLTDGGRINCLTGARQWLSGYKFIKVNVFGCNTITIKVNPSGSSDLGYAFYDSNDIYISGKNTTTSTITTITIPSNACFFRYGDVSSNWDDILSNKIKLSKIYEKSYKILDDRLDNLEHFKSQQDIINSSVGNDNLGYMDNRINYIWNGYGSVNNINGTLTVSPITEKSSLTVPCDVLTTPTTAYLTITKTTSPTYFKFKNSSGVESNFSTFNQTGTVLYQNNTSNKVGEVILADENIIVVYFEPSLINYTISSFSDSGRTVPTKLDIVINKSAIFYKTYTKNEITFTKKYLSRAEKIGSRLIGKNVLVFSDSQSSFIKYLADDWGCRVFTISNGGCRMGYVTGDGLGGETGTADNLWLCNFDRVKNFNKDIISNNIIMDYIINFTGGNATFEGIGNADELKFVLDNKNWFGNTATTDIFSSLSAQNKERFTSPLCYIASFVVMNRLFPKAIPVVCDLYNSVGGGNTQFLDNKWKDSTSVSNAIYGNRNGSFDKSRLLRDIAERIGAILVRGSETGLSVTNCPYYANDSVHANLTIAENLAYNVGLKLNFPTN